MTEVFRQIIDHPAAWTGPSIGGKDGLRYQLTPQHLKAIDEVLAKTRHIAPQAVKRAQFDHPVLNPMLAEVGDILMNGRGAVIITGVTRDRYSEEDFERIYCGFGTHWGIAVVQSSLGDMLGRVAFTPVGPDNPTGRAYRSNEELTPHTDTNEIVGLMAVQKAAKGGHSQLASSLAVHNEIFRTRPDLLDALYEGYYYASREHAKTGRPVTPYKVPVFCCVDGKVSSMCTAEFIRVAAQKLNEELPKKIAEGIDLYEQIAARDDIRVNFMLEPGEMMVFNNFTILHSRSSFEDGPGQKRNLLRLWLDVPKGRPVVHEYWLKAEEYRLATARDVAAAKGVAAAQ
jgi:hypothetical protein